MRIATFNLENLGGDKPASPLEERLLILRPQLERLHADILCLQEVNAVHRNSGKNRKTVALDKLLQGTQYESFHRTISRKADGSDLADRHNLVILSRWPQTKSRQYLHDKVGPPIHAYLTARPPRTGAASIYWDRPILYAIVETTSGPIHVLNLHLRAPLASFIPGQKQSPFVWESVSGWAEGYYISAIKRSGQALEARRIVDEIFDKEPNAKIVVSGDFNVEIREAPIKILAGDIEDTCNGRLASRTMTAIEKLAPDHRRFSVIHAGRKIMLDHILVSRSLLATYRDIEIHNEALGDELVAYTTVNASPETYHAPVVAIFEPNGINI